MSNEIFDDLDFNPLIEVETDEEEKARSGKTSAVITTENDLDEKGKKKEVPIVDDTIEVDEDSKENTPNNLEGIPVQEDNSSKESLKQWFSFYKERGLIAEDVEEEELEDFDSLLEKAQEKQLADTNAFIESYKAALPKKIRDLVEVWEEGAEEEAFNKIVSIKKEQVKLDKLDDESIKSNKELQKNVVREYMLKTTKLSEEKINKHIDRLDSIEELEEEAISAGKELKDIFLEEENQIKTQSKLKAKEDADRVIKQKNQIKEYISKTKNVIDDIDVTTKEKEEIENYIFNPVAKDQNGNPIFYIQKLMMEDPTGMAFKLNYLAVATKGFTDWSKITKKAVTKAAKQINTTFNPPPKGNRSSNPNTGNNDWRENLKQLNK